MDLMKWLERALGRARAAPSYVTVRRTDLLPLLNCSEELMVVEFPPDRRADAVAYRNEMALFRAGLLAAQRGERRN